jgi:hypothetical protein
MKKILLMAIYISLLVLVLSPSIFATWPPPGYIKNQQPINQPPVLNSEPWSDPMESNFYPWQKANDLYQFSELSIKYDVANIFLGLGNVIFGPGFNIGFIYLNLTPDKYNAKNLSARILYR